MKIIKKEKVEKFVNGETCIMYEYDFNDEKLDCGRAIINGRYPEKGFCLNEECKELIYILEGSGFLQIEDRKVEFSKGDSILIDKQEKFYWDADCIAIIVCNPSFNKEQYKFVK